MTEMSGFWQQYLFFGVAATAAVYWGTPYARKAVAEHGDTWGTTPATAEDVTDASLSRPPPLRIGRPRRVLIVPPEQEWRRDEARVSAGSAGPEAAIRPATDGGYWGAIVERVKCYRSSGEYLRHLEAGTLVEFSSAHASSGGDLAVCRVRDSGRWIPDILVPLSSIVRFAGTYSEVPADIRDRVLRYYFLKGKVREREQTLRVQAERSNPYAAAYRRAVDDYRRFEERVRELTRRRDAATGVDRIKHADALHAMRVEGTRLEQALERAAEPYKRWKNEHPFDDTRLRQDPEIRRMEGEIARLKPTVEERLGEG